MIFVQLPFSHALEIKGLLVELQSIVSKVQDTLPYEQSGIRDFLLDELEGATMLIDESINKVAKL